jgi:hypothetical protein
MCRRPLFLFLFATAAAGCAKDPGQGTTDRPPTITGGACITNADCPPTLWCLHQRCSERLPDTAPPGDADAADIAVAPASLDFGNVVPPATRTLAVVLENVGGRMVTLSRVQVSPGGSPFRVEPMGYGPFWIRPGRSREIFVTFVPTASAHVEAMLVIESESPTRSLTLLGN